MPQGCLQFVIVVFPDYTHLLFFLSLSVSPPTLGVVCCGASESKPKGTEIAGPLRPLKVWDPAS